MLKKKKNPLARLGWLGLIGIVGLVNNATWMQVFLLFFFFFTYWNVTPDELFWMNAKKAAVNAFVANITFTTLFLGVCTINAISSKFTSSMRTITEDIVQVDFAFYAHEIFIVGGYVISYMITICTFVFGLMYYRHKEKREPGEDAC